MEQLKVGFSRVDITPMLGIRIVGYFKERRAEGVLDNLEANTIAVSVGDQKAVLMNLDLCYMGTPYATEAREAVSKKTGLPMEAIYVQCNHTHTGPQITKGLGEPLEDEYFEFLKTRMADSAQMALNDLQPAKMGWGIGHAPNIAFIRRYIMKDGSVKTNPGVNNPDIVGPVGKVDDEVAVVRFDRENDTVVLVNFADHPDCVGGNLISADWPAFARLRVEKALDNTKCVVFNGAQGDVNHVNVKPQGGDLNDMFMDFDDVSRGYGHARHMGNVVAGGVLQAFDKVKYVEADSLRYMNLVVNAPSNMPKPEEMEEARYIHKMHLEGRDAELPYKGMMLTTMVAAAGRKIRLENGPESFPLMLSGVAIGNIALIGVPGEPFNGVGVGLKTAPGWDLVMPTCITNGAAGYFPMMDSYEEGGYEAGSSSYKAGVAELLIEEGKNLLAALR